MQDRYHKPPSKRRPKKGVLFCGFSCWLLTLLSIALFVWNWRSQSPPLNISWSLAIFGLLAISGLSLLLFSLKRIFFGPDRFGALTGLFLGSMPLLFWPACHLDALWRERSLRNGEWPLRDAPIALAQTAMADLESQWRYPRRTAGRWVTLVDAGQPDNCQTLLEAMDRHVQDQCDVLGVTPERALYWARGPLLGHSEQALIGWAIGPSPQTDPSSTADMVPSQADKHAASLALLSILLPPHATPPSLLTQGWARYSSQDRVQLQKALLDAWADQVTDRSWAKLYQPTSAPYLVDLFSGPIVEYLIEQHGGPLFWELLSTSSASSFTQAFQKTYHSEWSEVEPKFLQWLQSQHPDRSLPQEAPSQVTLQPWQARQQWLESLNIASETQSDWNRVLAPLLERYHDRFHAPSGAWRSIKEWKQKTAASPGSLLIKNQEIIKILLDDREAWYAQSRQGESHAIVAANELYFEATRKDAGSARHGKQVTTKAERLALREQVIDANRAMALLGDPLERLFQSRELSPRIESCTTQDQHLSVLVRFQSSAPNTDSAPSERPVSCRWTCNLAKSGLLESWIQEFADGTRVEEKLELQSHEEEWLVREISVARAVDKSPQLESTQRIDFMEPSQRRSFQDELRSISLESDQVVLEMPRWLSLSRLGMLVWSILGAVFAIAFALLRL